MLLDLKQALNPGDNVPVMLVIESQNGRREALAVGAPVRALSGAPAWPQR